MKISNGGKVGIYVTGVLVLAIATIAGVIAILALRPEADNTPVIATLIAFATPVMLAFLAVIQRENHLAMNSRLDELLSASKTTAHAEGVADERARVKD